MKKIETVYKIGNKTFTDKSDAEEYLVQLEKEESEKLEFEKKKSEAKSEVDKAYKEYLAAREKWLGVKKNYSDKYSQDESDIKKAFEDLFNIITL